MGRCACMPAEGLGAKTMAGSMGPLGDPRGHWGHRGASLEPRGVPIDGCWRPHFSLSCRRPLALLLRVGCGALRPPSRGEVVLVAWVPGPRVVVPTCGWMRSTLSSRGKADPCHECSGSTYPSRWAARPARCSPRRGGGGQRLLRRSLAAARHAGSQQGLAPSLTRPWAPLAVGGSSSDSWWGGLRSAVCPARARYWLRWLVERLYPGAAGYGHPATRGTTPDGWDCGSFGGGLSRVRVSKG